MTNEAWGIMPVLFHIAGFPVDSYSVFVFLGLVAGTLVYVLQLKRDGIRNSNAFYIALFALAGGAIGAKLPIVIIYWNQLNANPESANILLSGRTIVGGLIGGAAGTFLAKKAFKIKERMGNQIAIPVAAGMAVGRIGCLLRGCCYGKPTDLPWGLDFGDHIGRHPTQVYEFIFDLMLIAYLSWRKGRGVGPGGLFKLFLNAYLVFRFLLEFIRVEKIAFLGLTDFQLLCIVSLIYINRLLFLQFFRRKDVQEG